MIRRQKINSTLILMVFCFSVIGNSSFLLTSSEFSSIPSAAAVAPTLDPITQNPVDSRVVYLTWNVIPDTTEYRVYRDTIFISNIIGMSPYATVNTPAFTETINQAGTFYYVVTDVVGGVESAISNCQSVVVTVDPLAAPTVQLLGTMPVQLTWNMIDRATSYYVFKSNSPISSIEGMSPYATMPAVLPLFQETVSINGTYYYAVASTDGTSNSSINGYITAVVEVPPIEQPIITSAVVDNYQGRITVQWNQIEGVQSYRVYFSTSPITDGNVGSLTPISTINTQYITQTIIQNTTDGDYYIAVVATYGSVMSAVSVNSFITITMEPLPVPTLTSVSPTSTSGYVELSWTNIDNATYYQLYRNVNASIPALNSTYMVGTYYTNETTDYVTSNGTYYYVVRAVLGTIHSDSTEIFVNVDIVPGDEQLIKLSVDITNTNISGQTVLSWSRVNGASYFYIFRSEIYSENLPDDFVPYASVYGTTYTYTDTNYVNGSYTYGIIAYFSSTNTNTTGSNTIQIVVGIPSLAPCTLDPISSANGQTGRIVLNWNDVSRATSYEVYRWSVANPANTSIGSIPLSNYVDIVSVNDTYTYQVIARLGDLSSCSNTVSIVVNILPDTETSVTVAVQSASNQTGYIVLSWTFLTSATSYSIYRQQTPITSIGTLSPIATVSQPQVAFNDQLLTNGTYYYRIVPAFGQTVGTLSNEVSVEVGIEPLQAVVLRPLVHANGDGRILLNWTTNTRYTSYKIFSSTSGPITDITGLTANATAYTGTYTDQVYGSEMTYYYVVVAYLNVSASPLSNYEQIYVEIASLANTTVYEISPNPNTVDGKNLIRWNRITRAQSYNVLRSTNPITSANGPGVVSIANITSSYTTSYTDQILATNTYYYAVVGMIGPLYGNLSNCVSVYVNIAPLDAPYLQPITPNPNYDGSITITWNTSARADRYYIYRDTYQITNSYPNAPIGTSTSGSFHESGLGTGHYYYAVRASLGTVGAMYSPMSNCQDVIVSNELPAAPVLALITENSKTTSANITLQWTYTSSVTANAFLVYRSTTLITSLTGLTPVASVNGNLRALNMTLNSTGKYYFAIAGQNPSGIGLPSNVRQLEYQYNFAPEISSPTDITFVVNSTGHVLSWSVLDINTSVDATYTIYRNGTSVGTGSWKSGDIINFTVDDLDVGSYEFRIVVNDGFTLTAEDPVLVTVTPGESSNSTDYTQYLIYGGAAAGVVAVISLLLKKKKPASVDTGDAGEITF